LPKDISVGENIKTLVRNSILYFTDSKSESSYCNKNLPKDISVG